MSFSLNEVARLQRAGGAVLAKYKKLLAEADGAMHDSLAHRALGEFQKSWEQDPQAVIRAAEHEHGSRGGSRRVG
jgi:hypothetical protein